MRMPEHIKNMKRRVRGLSLLPFLLFPFLLSNVACSSIDCPVENVVATVYQIVNEEGDPVEMDDTLSVETKLRNRTDSLILNKKNDVAIFQLPMGYVTPEDTLVFIVNSKSQKTYRDTLYIKKENFPQFESVDCKITYFHRIISTRLSSHNAIDSIRIIKPEVNYDLSSEHFHIYFKTWD